MLGGERARVAIAMLSLAKANFAPDEPTNHLDIASQEVLQEVLQTFAGTLLMVSHDRFLIREVSTQVWAIADGTLHIFETGYDDYQAWHQMWRSAPRRAKQVDEEAREQREAERQARRLQERALAQQQARLNALEEEIHGLEQRMKELTHALDAAGRDQDISRVANLGGEYRQIEVRLSQLLEEWARVADTPVGLP